MNDLTTDLFVAGYDTRGFALALICLLACFLLAFEVKGWEYMAGRSGMAFVSPARSTKRDSLCAVRQPRVVDGESRR